MSEVAEKKKDRKGDFPKSRPCEGGQVSLRCSYVMEDGRKCKQRPWLGGELCFQHDPEAAELRKLAGRPSKNRLTKGQEVEELLDEVMEELRAGRMKPGQAYAAGYLAQLMLAARASRQREVKLDVKWFWEMVDVILALEDGQKSLEEKEKREAKEREEPQMNADERRSEEEGKDEDDSEEKRMGQNADDEVGG